MLRAIMIGLGATIVSQFFWVLCVFGLFLIATGVKMIVFADREFDVASNPALSLAVTFGLLAAAVVWSLVKTRCGVPPGPVLSQRCRLAQSSRQP